jgi:addiction module HigA family antidote
VNIERPALRKLAQLDWSAVLDDLAKDIGVPAQRIGEIVAGRRSITADTDLRLCRYFGLSDGWWLRGQVACDTAIAREVLQKELAAIQRCSLLAA